MNGKIDNLLYPYLAGWVDGDGCIFVDKKRRYESRFTLKITDLEPLHFFKEKLNMTQKIQVKKPSNRGFVEKQQYEIKMSGKQNIPFLKNIAPYLVEKQHKVNEFLLLYPEVTDPMKDLPYLQHTKEEFFAWLAGYFEAEGHVSIRKRVKKKLLNSGLLAMYGHSDICLQLVNTNLLAMSFILNRLKKYNFLPEDRKLFTKKANIRMCNITKRLIQRKEVHRLHLTGKAFLLTQQQMMPYMLIKRKKDKILEGLDLMKNFKYKRNYIKEYFNYEKDRQIHLS